MPSILLSSDFEYLKDCETTVLKVWAAIIMIMIKTLIVISNSTKVKPLRDLIGFECFTIPSLV